MGSDIYTMKIKYSKAFMEKFGETVLNRKNEIFVERLKPTGFNLFDYLIDWKTRKRVHLVNWLKNQIDGLDVHYIVEQNGWYDLDNDDKALAILRWVYSNYTYVGDQQLWDVGEKWATFEESYKEKNKEGDCEDGAIAIFVLARKAGIPENRIKLVTSQVVGGGHAFILYTADDGIDYVLDWCYFYDKQDFETRPMFWDLPNYYFGDKIWFAVNDKTGFIKQ